MKGTSSLISAGVTSETSSMPHDFADAIRRRSSSMRSSVRATSMPPHTVSTPSSSYWRTLSAVSVRHLARVVDREDEVGRVAGGAARVRERALVDQHEVRPAEPREVADQAVAHDPGADDDCARLRRQGTRCSGLVCHGDHLGVGAGQETDISHGCTRRESSAARPSRSRSAASRHRSRGCSRGSVSRTGSAWS